MMYNSFTWFWIGWMNDFVLHNAVYFPFAGISSGLINFFVIDIKKFLKKMYVTLDVKIYNYGL